MENRYVREVALRQNVLESTVYIQQREGIEHIAQRLTLRRPRYGVSAPTC
ncbi:MAG: hypothetical protein R2873_19350 [Caldilineaceae bacterium]